jgi:FkbH-like protein
MERIKLVVMDLDGTLWDGILLEDGLDGVTPKAEVIEALRSLDRRGILLSVASKNHPADVEKALRRFGIEDLFLFPQVTWDPKPEAVGRILRAFRFSPAHALFVDDTPFEREAVRGSMSQIRVATPEELPRLCATPELAGNTTGEAKTRKAFYRDEERRRQAETKHDGTYRAFLKGLNLEVRMGPATEASADRIVELVQRTNQINFSTNRYQRAEVLDLLHSAEHASYVISARDRFGRYGIIGFACVHRSADGVASIQDLMLSCRIQGRGVEAATIATLAAEMQSAGCREIQGVYRRTERNQHISSIYTRLGFQAIGRENERELFSLELAAKLPSVPEHIRLVLCDSVASELNEGIPFVRRIVADLAAQGALHGEIIDIGAGWDGVLGEDCDSWLATADNRHVRLDLERYPRTDIVADAQSMPELASERFDALLCLEVLEHCTDPFALAREAVRVLRPGGTAVVSAPMNYVIHEHPGDYWRFTPAGLQLLFGEAVELLDCEIEGDPEHPIRTVLTLAKRPAEKNHSATGQIAVGACRT